MDDKKWEDLDLTNDEVKRLGEALKKEEFRKLLVEYAEEISDPENRKKYEEEIARLESERGMDVKFVNPNPGYVIKTCLDDGKKLFINICKNEHIQEPKCEKKKGPNGRVGHQWSIPHSFAPVRDDIDKSGSKCKVIDFVINPGTYRMAESNPDFKKMLHNTALDGIENQFGLSPDRKNLKFPKITFKGTPTATVIRTRKDEAKSKPTKQDDDDPISKLKYPYSNKTSEEMAAELAEKNKKAKKNASEVKPEVLEDKYQTPKYNIIHRGYLDFQDYRAAPDAKQSLRPKELVVEILLPMIKSASSVDLDVLPKSLKLLSEKPAKYKLDLSLPYEVDDSNGSAKFDKSKNKLVVTLPVVPAKILPVVLGAGDEALVTEVEAGADGEAAQTEPDDIPPLIEVIPKSQTNNSDTQHSNGSHSESAHAPVESETHVGDDILQNDVKSKKVFTLPEFDFLQDDETVTLIFDVKKAQRDSLHKLFPSKRTFELTVTSLGSGGFPMDWRACVKFDDDCAFDESSSYVDVGLHNVVVTFVKADTCLGNWKKFSIGLTMDNMQVRIVFAFTNPI